MRFLQKISLMVFVIFFVKSKILPAYGISCENVTCNQCHCIISYWMGDEYKEPPKPSVDWSKVPVDTKIFVSMDGENWERRYFAKYENNKVYFFPMGKDSWSSYGDPLTTFKYAKLAEEDSDEKNEQ